MKNKMKCVWKIANFLQKRGQARKKSKRQKRNQKWNHHREASSVNKKNGNEMERQKGPWRASRGESPNPMGESKGKRNQKTSDDRGRRNESSSRDRWMAGNIFFERYLFIWFLFLKYQIVNGPEIAFSSDQFWRWMNYILPGTQRTTIN